MGSADKFCLRWNDFEANISTAFAELRSDKDFFDVTLASEDEHQVKAHKVILAACSPFFRRVLKCNPHDRPLLYLKGVRYSELVAVLNFMYHGEVNVAQDELNSFLAVAEELSVKGLTTGDQAGSSSSSKSKPRPASMAKSRPTPTASSSSSSHPPAKRPRVEGSTPVSRPSAQSHEEVLIKDEPRVGGVAAEAVEGMGGDDQVGQGDDETAYVEGDENYEGYEGYDDNGDYGDAAGGGAMMPGTSADDGSGTKGKRFFFY